jgi:hypothetical protein
MSIKAIQRQLGFECLIPADAAGAALVFTAIDNTGTTT